MLQDLDSTIEQRILAYFAEAKGEVDISFDQPSSEWSARLSRPTINCWLYDLRENVRLRNVEITASHNRKELSELDTLPKHLTTQLRRAPVRYDASYLVTAWSRRVQDEHMLIWRTLAAFSQFIAFKPEDCVGMLREQPYDLPIAVAQDNERGLHLPDLWGVLDNKMRVGFTLVVTLAMDLDLVVTTPLVIKGDIFVRQAPHPPETASTPKVDKLDTTIHHTPDSVRPRDRGSSITEVSDQIAKKTRDNHAKKEDKS